LFLEEHEQDYEHSQDAKRYQDVIFDSPADPEDQAREGWQLRAFGMPINTCSNEGTTLTIKTIRIPGSDNQNCHGIEHRCDNLAFDLLRLFHELRQARQNTSRTPPSSPALTMFT